jgi:hypothetical protein
MPYEPHFDIATPDDDHTLWRFMDFAKFVYLLRYGLHFTRADRLGDEFEGALPSQTVMYYLRWYENQEGGGIVYGPPGLDGTYPEEFRDIVRLLPPPPAQLDSKPESEVRMLPEPVLVQGSAENQRHIRENARVSRRSVFVSCWHDNEHESAAMWDLYVKGGAGIAIRSSVARLKACFAGATEHRVWIGNVRYFDYSTETFYSAAPGLTPVMFKRKSFAHESEVRAIFDAWHVGDRYKVGAGRGDYIEDGIDIPSDLDTLIERIVVAPQAADWFKGLVRVVREDYRLGHKEVVISSLRERPLW